MNSKLNKMQQLRFVVMPNKDLIGFFFKSQGKIMTFVNLLRFYLVLLYTLLLGAIYLRQELCHNLKTN